ncbi:MAG: metallophosphoesterase family protein [Candidatus Bathyarchaeia archaeon]
MKILVGTDFHGVVSAFEDFAEKAEEKQSDLIVVCGDITHFGTLQQAKQLLSLLTDIRKPVLFVPGNCDPPALLGVDVEGAICIHGKSVSYDDLTFIGVGGSPPTPFNTPFEMTEEDIIDTLNHASENLNNNSRRIVLVSHTPPQNTNLDKTFFGTNAGSLSVRSFIENRNPAIVFCGHIHEAKGKDKIKNTIIVNPGPARHGNYAEAFFNDEIVIDFDSLQLSNV